MKGLVETSPHSGASGFSAGAYHGGARSGGQQLWPFERQLVSVQLTGAGATLADNTEFIFLTEFSWVMIFTFRIDTLNSGSVLFNLANSANNVDNILLEEAAAGAVRLRIYNAAQTLRKDWTFGTLTAGQWHQVAIMQRPVAGTFTVWVDGVDVSSGATKTVDDALTMGSAVRRMAFGKNSVQVGGTSEVTWYGFLSFSSPEGDPDECNFGPFPTIHWNSGNPQNVSGYRNQDCMENWGEAYYRMGLNGITPAFLGAANRAYEQWGQGENWDLEDNAAATFTIINDHPGNS